MSGTVDAVHIKLDAAFTAIWGDSKGNLKGALFHLPYHYTCTCLIHRVSIAIVKLNAFILTQLRRYRLFHYSNHTKGNPLAYTGVHSLQTKQTKMHQVQKNHLNIAKGLEMHLQESTIIH